MNDITDKTTVIQSMNLGEFHGLKKTKTVARGSFGEQTFEIVNFETCGTGLLIDGCIQSTELDEQQYHEALVFPAYTFVNSARSVLCIGGGTGGLLKQVLKIPELEEVVLVDISETLHEISIVHLPHMHEDTLTDPRVNLRFGDPATILAEINAKTDKRFDLIIADLPDSTDGSYATGFFTTSAYQLIKSLLSPGGVYLTHGGQAHHRSCDFLGRVSATIRDSFNYHRIFTTFVPTFGIPWSFVVASEDNRLFDLSEEQFAAKCPPALASTLTSYDFTTHQHMFNLPKPLREALAIDTHRSIESFDVAKVTVAVEVLN